MIDKELLKKGAISTIDNMIIMDDMTNEEFIIEFSARYGVMLRTLRGIKPTPKKFRIP